jgi:hypothetical protein
MNRIPNSGPKLKVTSKIMPSKNSSHNFCTPLFDKEIVQKCAKITRVIMVNEVKLSNVRQEASRHFRNKKREYFNTKLTSFNQTVRIRTSETYIGVLLNLRSVTNRELSLKRMIQVIY